jgi:outer membrane putative beta-barrel porin/alpha-amylase
MRLERSLYGALIVAVLLTARGGLAQPVNAAEARPIAAPSEGLSTLELAKLSQDPIADMNTSPFQNDINFGFGPEHRIQDVLYLVPIYPVAITSKVNLITRTIAPLIWQPQATPPGSTTFGMGDILFSAFVSPRSNGTLSWGVGPAILLPTGTNAGVGAQNSGQWCAGPTASIAYSPGRLVMGLLVNNIFSFNGRVGAPSVDALTMQPFFNVNLPMGFFLTTSPMITADWERPNDQRWIVPIGGGVGAVIKIGRFGLGLNAQAYWNAVTTDAGGEWTLRFTVAGLFPSKREKPH